MPFFTLDADPETRRYDTATAFYAREVRKYHVKCQLQAKLEPLDASVRFQSEMALAMALSSLSCLKKWHATANRSRFRRDKLENAMENARSERNRTH